MLVIRDPLHNNIRLDPLARELIETPAFQRLRYVRQLGLAFLVYPGATHTRFEHALGTYHLARRSLALLGEEGGLARVPAEECAIVTAILHCRYQNKEKTVDTRLRYADLWIKRTGKWLYAFGHAARL